MKNRSELRDIIIKVLYQVYILENTNVKYDVNTLIKEQLEIENDNLKKQLNELREIIDRVKEIVE